MSAVLRKGALRWTVLGLALGCLVLPVAGRAQTAASIEGVWRIARPQTQLQPANGKPIPFTPEGRRLYDANRAAAAKGDFSFDPSMTQCSSPGQPRLMLTSEPLAIFVRPRMVTMLYQWNRLFRQISVGKTLPNPLVGEAWWRFGALQGRSTAEWDGGVLVIHTLGLSDQKLLDSFTPNSDKLELTEHVRLRDPNTLEDRITIADPDIFTRPWDAVVTYARLPDQTLPFPEDVCLDRLRAGQPAIER